MALHGFAENCETGGGLRDRAYIWTAAVHLVLAAAHPGRAARHAPAR
ncbi:hypothetical protein [Actinoplanes xinjiangensis]